MSRTSKTKKNKLKPTIKQDKRWELDPKLFQFFFNRPKSRSFLRHYLVYGIIVIELFIYFLLFWIAARREENFRMERKKIIGRKSFLVNKRQRQAGKRVKSSK